MKASSAFGSGKHLHRVERLWRDLSSLQCGASQTFLGTAKRKNPVREGLQAKELPKRQRLSAWQLQAVGAATAAPEVSIDELKAQFLDSLFGIERGLKASSEIRAELSELIGQLEANNPTPSPNEELQLLDGTWKLVYTANSEVLVLLSLGYLPLVRVGDIVQKIDSYSRTVENKVQLLSPFSRSSFSATAGVEVAGPRRLQVAFRQGRLQVPQLLQDVEFPSSLSVLGRQVDLTSLKSALQPVNASVKETALQLSDLARRLPDLQFQINGQQAQSWLLNTYLDSDLRISRGDGGSIFVLMKSPEFSTATF